MRIKDDHPELFRQLHPTRDVGLHPGSVTNSSHAMLWWLCGCLRAKGGVGCFDLRCDISSRRSGDCRDASIRSCVDRAAGSAAHAESVGARGFRSREGVEMRSGDSRHLHDVGMVP